MNQSVPGKAILLVDHGSVKAEANELLEEIARLVAGIAPGYHVEAAHMELAPPDIAAGVAALVLGPREGLELLDRLEGIEGMIVTKDQVVLRSRGLGRYTA